MLNKITERVCCNLSKLRLFSPQYSSKHHTLYKLDGFKLLLSLFVPPSLHKNQRFLSLKTLITLHPIQSNPNQALIKDRKDILAQIDDSIYNLGLENLVCVTLPPWQMVILSISFQIFYVTAWREFRFGWLRNLFWGFFYEIVHLKKKICTIGVSLQHLGVKGLRPAQKA